MTTIEFLSDLRRLGVTLWGDGDRLGYSAPKGTMTPALRAEIASRKADILAFLRQADVNAHATLPPLFPRSASEDGDLPLSFAQASLWFLAQLDPSSSAYNMPFAFRLTGSLNVEALEQSLFEIVRRHDILRTTFPAVEGQPVQVISAPGTFALPVVDISELPESKQGTEVRRLATEAAQRAFDLSRGPLWRVTLLKLGEQEHVLLLTTHHIVSDGWSIGVFMQELQALYEAISCGKPSPLLELPIQYADFALWQRQWLKGKTLEEHLSYWKAQLHGAPAVLELPTDRPRPAVQTDRGGVESFQLGPDLTKQLKTLSQQSGATLYMTLLSAFVTLLSRDSGQQDMIIGSPIANRNRRETESLIGFLVNTLALRIDMSGNPTFEELLSRVRQLTLDAFAHQDLPFEKLVSELQPERHLNHHPLFQVMFDVQHAPLGRLELPGLTLTPLEMESVTAKFDLTLSMEETEPGLKGKLEYNTDLFDAATIRRMAGHLPTLLEGIVADPQRCISELPLLTEIERHQMLVEWNNTQAEYPQDRCLHQLFEAQVERTPEAVAVVFEAQQLTYRQLNAKANQLAHHLIALGVGPEMLVGLCVERSIEMVVGLLGILKAGGAYVPLDPAYPKERLAFMLADAQVQVLLTQARLMEELPDHRSKKVFLDTDWETVAKQSEENPTSGVTAENLAYVIYTSGSTGQPKGVAVPHRAVNRLVINTNYVKLEPSDRVAQASNSSFDAATFEIWGALLHGARLVGIARDVTLSPQDFAAHIREQEISVLFLTTALFNQLASKVPWTFSSVRHLLFGGEAVDPKWVKEVLLNGPPQRLLHVYGPTESTTFASWYEVTDVPVGALTIPIGHPIANTQIYLLDAQGQPVAVGVEGEIHIGGDGLARGYLNRPELTAEKFIPNPFSDEPGTRLYKTGDLGRYLPDGNIEFLGRIDHQVKIRGFRVELGEIEAVLAQHPSVQQTVVLAREEKPGDKRLVAYIVPNPEQDVTPSELRRFLLEKLPDYMVPAAFVILDALPLTPNGKVDRRALPAPEGHRPQLGADYVMPQTEAERRIAAVWGEVLQVEKVGIHDNFFEVGGHSLLAIQLLNRLRDAFQVDVPLRRLFEAPTVAGIAASIDLNPANLASRSTPHPIRAIPRDGDLPLSFAQQRLWFLDQLEGQSAAYNIPAALRLDGPLHVAALEKSLTEIVRRHEILRSAFPVVNGSPVQVIAPPLPVTLLVLDLRNLSEVEQSAEVQRLASEEAQCSFDLATGPLLRALLVRLGEAEHVLLLTMHHIVFDGWSIGIVIRELAALYEASCTGTSPALPALPIQYADFAHWQRQWLSGEVLEGQLNYWKKQLAGAPSLLELPTDRSRPPVQTSCGDVERFQLSPERTEKLKTLSQQSGATLYMTLLGAFATLFSRYSGQQDIVIGSPVANRNRRETESLIGFFVNTLALRLDMSGNPTFFELLSRVQRFTLDAFAHQDVPFEKLVEELRPERHLSHSPLFQVMFVLQNAPMGKLELPGLTLTPLEVKHVTAKFDLTLSMEETEQGLIGELEYNTDLFDAATIQRLAGHFQTLLEGMVENPEQRLSELPLLTEAERHQLLVEWNNTQAEYPKDKCLHQWFEAQAERTPDAVAVVFENQQLTYRQLNARANQLAHHLQLLGVGPEVLVGLCVERSIEMVVGLLGILKAGGAYVPLDPTYPKERLTFMLADAQVPVLLTQARLIERLPEHRAKVVCLDADWEAIARRSEENPVSEATPENLAYVIYTSGSTGRPKGVLGLHRGAVNRLAWMWKTYPFEGGEVCCQKTALNFVDSVWELFGGLLFGIPTVVIPDEVLKHPHRLVQTLAAKEVTRIVLVPSLLRVLLDSVVDLQNQLPKLKSWVTSGESLSLELFNRFAVLMPQSVLLNLYGSSEVSADVTWYDTRLWSRDLLSVPIGRPIANTQIYLLDSHLNPVPIGVPGEVHVGGAGLARGYLNRPELTAEKFIPNPFSEEKSACLYKTGDLARYLSDGVIEFLGRIDHQVKIRGFRIELGEIEAVLGKHPSVRAAVVLAREEKPGDKRLVAYIVPAPEQNPTSSELRRFLLEKLPEYMVPAAFVMLSEMPLTPNGKVDRRALPAPDAFQNALQEGFVAPRDPLELQLVHIWEEVLDIHPLGIRDNFFDLGGHSLLAVRLMAQIQRQFGKKLTLATLFQATTIEQLAGILRQQTDSRPWSSLVAIQPSGEKRPFFCVPGIGGNVISLHDLARHLGKDQPFYGLQALGLDGESAPHTRVEEMAAHYIEALKTVQPQGPYRLGGHSFGSYVAFEMAQQLQKQGHEVSRLAVLDATAPVSGKKPVGSDWDEATWLFQIARLIERLFGKNLEISSDGLHPLDSDAQLNDFMERLKQIDLLPPEAEIAQVRGLVQVFKANLKAHYMPQAVYPTRIALFKASEVHPEDVANDEPAEIRQVEDSRNGDAAWGWGEFSAGPVEVYVVPGDHFTMMTEPHVQILTERLRSCLERAQSVTRRRDE